MKKQLIFFFTSCLILLIITIIYTQKHKETNINNKSTQITTEEQKSYFYPFRRWENGFTRFYSDEIKKKHPDIVEIFDKILKKRNEYFRNITSQNLKEIRDFSRQGDIYEVKRDKHGLLGVYEIETGKQIIPNKYKYLEICSFSYAMFFNAKNSSIGEKYILDYHNNILFKANYDELNCKTFEGGIQTINGNKYGLVSFSGKEILEPKYDSITTQEHFGESGGYYYIVKKGNLYGVWDNHGNIIIPLQEKILSKSDKNGPFFIYKDENSRGIIDIYGNKISPSEYRDILFHFDTKNTGVDLADIRKANQGQKDKRDKIISKYGDNIIQLSENYYAVGRQQMGMYIIDRNGEKTSDKKYDIIRRLNENFAHFINFNENHMSHGVIDFKGNIIMQKDNISDIYDATKEGLILFSDRGKYGIAYRNNIITEPIYKKIYFYKGHVLIQYKENGKEYYYISSFKNFIKRKGNLKNCQKIQKKSLKNIDDNCFKARTELDKEIIFCKD